MKKNGRLYTLIAAIGLILLMVNAPAMADKLSDPVVSQMLDQFDYNKQKPDDTGASLHTNADKLGKEIIINRLDKNFLIICLLIAAMLVSQFTLLYFINKTKPSAEEIFHASGLVLIIFGTILVVILVETDQQLTAPIGILGAIAGYLFGRLSQAKKGASDENKAG